jgi:pimeloyl-ACP methyl ester carboxylesterase
VIIGEPALIANSQDLRLWTERFGAPADPVVLLIMGTAAQAIGWPDELVEVLVDGGRQVIRFDHRDTGQSGCVDFAAAPYTIGDAAAARRHVEDSIARARDFQAATQHDLAGRQMTTERQVPLSRITAPALVIHGTSDPLLPLAHGQAVAALIPGARFEAVQGMGHGFFAPGIPARGRQADPGPHRRETCPGRTSGLRGGPRGLPGAEGLAGAGSAGK